jgi:prepilin-type N-terminal cleavage/methylation domain-containing protein
MAGGFVMTGVDRKPASRAFTLLELMMVISILGVVMGMTVIALNSAGAETSMSTMAGAMQETTNQFAQRLVSELRNASRASIAFESNGVETADHGDCIKFRVPVDEDTDGSVDLDAGGKAIFGATLCRTHTADADIVYRFRTNQVGGADEILDEAALGIDVNGDGDELDSFKRGQFTRTAPDSSGGVPKPRATSDRWFLYGDEDGNGIEEPVFELAADGTIMIRLLAADVMVRLKTPVLALVTTSVRPYNP